jgi:hypothetical protein
MRRSGSVAEVSSRAVGASLGGVAARRRGWAIDRGAGGILAGVHLRRPTGSPRESDGGALLLMTRTDCRTGGRPVDERSARGIVRPALTTVLAVLLVILLSTLLARAGGTTLQGTPYRDSPAFRIWALFAAAAMVGWIGMSIELWRLGRLLEPRERGMPRWVPPVLYVVLAVAVYAIVREFLTPDLAPPLPGDIALRWLLLLVVGLLASGPPVLGLWLVYLRLHDLSYQLARSDSRPIAAVFVPEFRTLWRYAENCLVGLVVIAFTYVVQSGLLRKALLATGYSPEQVPISWLLLLGGFLTAVALLVYSPFFLSWSGHVARLLEVTYPLPANGLPTDKWMADRNRLQTFLNGNTTLRQNLSVLLGVIAPFAGSVLSAILPELEGG